jgi:hypothetical protein
MKKALLLKAFCLFALIIPHFYAGAQSLEEDTVKRVAKIIQDSKQRAVYLEIGGPGLAATINYDTRFGSNSGNTGLGYRVGAGYYNTGANWVATAPFQVNYLYGGNVSFLEVGVGTTFVRSVGSTKGITFEFDNITGFIATASIGYRYQQSNGGINFRIAFCPIYYDDGLTFDGGLSIGYTF